MDVGGIEVKVAVLLGVDVLVQVAVGVCVLSGLPGSEVLVDVRVGVRVGGNGVQGRKRFCPAVIKEFSRQFAVNKISTLTLK